MYGFQVFTADFCRKADKEAREDHVKLAPHYQSKEDAIRTGTVMQTPILP